MNTADLAATSAAKQDRQDLTGQVALVTGAGRMRGVGHSVALALAMRGCDIALHGSGSSPDSWPDSERQAGWRGLDSVADQIRALGRRAEPVIADLRARDQVDAMVAKVVADFGRLDILVNNAAAPRGDDRVPVVEMSDDIWLNIIDVKVNGAFYASRAVARILIAQGQGGRIVNISSMAGKLGAPDRASYCVANAALQTLGACMARELAEHQVTVNSLCLGMVDTSRIDDMGRGEAFRAAVKARVPLNRVATPEEIGEVVAFLCGESAGYITGQSINVDGGVAIH
ncbi:MAG: short-chain dehydrogenase [Caulobacteraceae bacterium]|nr:short-chain dehydrogenase [Caulobacteraceae bacterium]